MVGPLRKIRGLGVGGGAGGGRGPEGQVVGGGLERELVVRGLRGGRLER